MPRLIVRLALAVVVLVVLLVGADRLTLYLVTRSVVDELQQTQSLPQPPDVTIHGFPFLTQAVSGRYDSVDVTMRDVPATNDLVVKQLDTTLSGVHAPLGQAVSGKLNTLAVDHADAVAQITFAELETAANKTLDGTGVTVTLGRARADRVSVAAKVDTLLGTFDVTGQAQLAVTRGQIAVKVLPATLTGFPAELRDQVAGLVDLTGLTPELPFGFKISSVTVAGTGLDVRATGTSLTIG